MLLVLIDGSDEPSLGPDVVAALAGLGVSSVGVLRDERSVGVVLEGWAFDPARSGDAAIRFLVRSPHAVRILRSIAHVGVTAHGQRIRPVDSDEGDA